MEPHDPHTSPASAPSGGGSTQDQARLVELDAALSWLESRSTRAARVADARLFTGLGDAELAGILDCPPEEARLVWRAARAWILSRLDEPVATEAADFEALDARLGAALRTGRPGTGVEPLLERLLERDATPDPRVDDPELGVEPARADALPRIPGFHVLRRVGAGGMGAVYEARQEQPARRVALKVLRSGGFDRSTLRRFELEVELLARLQHPGIAQVFATGIFDGPGGAQPWFAMELIEGADLLVHARELPLPARVELLARIADAVQHAHQRGVIHRDLKPENVLVDREGRPKVLDFGVGRAVEEEHQRGSLATLHGQVLGTLAYMSPEQAAGDPGGVDTRTDVYSLGVIAYELFSGQLPIQTAGRSMPSALLDIQQKEPPRLGRLAPRLRGDLETIVAKAMSKEPARRYATAAELAADLRRHLAHQPIEARPPSAAYQLSRFARRNRVLVGAAALIGVLIVIAASLTRAESRRRLEAELETARAEREAALATGRGAAVKDYVLNRLLSSASPFEEGPDVRVRDVVERATEEVDTAFEGEPELEAELRHVLGTAWKELGEPTRAKPLLERAFEMRLERGGRAHPDTLATSEQLATVEVLLGRPERALELLREDLELFRASQGPEGRDTLRVEHDLALTEFYLGRIDDAVARLERALDARRRTLGEEDEATLNSTANLAALLLYTEETERAAELARRAFEARERRLGPDDARTMRDLGMFAGVLQSNGRSQEAAELLAPRMAAIAARFGPDHDQVQGLRSTLAWALMDLRRFDEARALREEVAAALEAELGRSHTATLTARNDLAVLLQRTGARTEAEALYVEVIADASAALGPDSLDLARMLNCYASLLTEDLRLDEAEELYLEILRIYEESGAEAHADLVMARANYGAWLMRSRRYEDALESLREALAREREIYPAGHRYIASETRRIGECLVELGRFDEAEEHLRGALESSADDARWTAQVRVLLARALDGQERVDEAAVELREARRVAEGEPGAAATAAEAARRLGELGL